MISFTIFIIMKQPLIKKCPIFIIFYYNFFIEFIVMVIIIKFYKPLFKNLVFEIAVKVITLSTPSYWTPI